MLRFAYELADSGRFRDWTEIQHKLYRRFGDDQGVRILRKREVRDELDRRCLEAANKKK